MSPLAVFAGPWAPVARMALLALACGALWAHGWWKGNVHGTEKLTAFQGEQAKADTKLAAARERIVLQTEVKWRERIVKVTTAGQTIEREVKVYVTKEDDSAAVVPVGFVRSFNAAWSGAPAGPPAESDRGPSGYPLSAVAGAEANNATTCRAWKEQRDGLIDFYRKLQAKK